MNQDELQILTKIIEGYEANPTVELLPEFIHSLKQTIAKIENSQQQTLVPICGLYLSDGERNYGFSFDQLQYFVRNRLNGTDNWGYGIDSLFKWLWEVNHTSLGDIHTDLVKFVHVSFERPSDLTEQQSEKYDSFWLDVEKLLYNKRNG